MARKQQRTGPPDFIGVGAQRAGTTWWFRLLMRNPQIRPPRRRKKELHFFDRFCAREMTEADVAAYYELFPRGRNQIAGEWTPRYMSDPTTPRLLARAAPDAKLLVLLRDPIERFRSGIQHRLARDPDRGLAVVAADAVERGRYATQIERLRDHFDPSRILVLQYERCRADPHAEYARTLRFLGLPDDHEPVTAEKQRGTTMESRKVPLWPDLEEALRAALEGEVERVAELVPDLDLSLWKHFAHLAPASRAS